MSTRGRVRSPDRNAQPSTLNSESFREQASHAQHPTGEIKRERRIPNGDLSICRDEAEMLKL